MATDLEQVQTTIKWCMEIFRWTLKTMQMHQDTVTTLRLSTTIKYSLWMRNWIRCRRLKSNFKRSETGTKWELRRKSIRKMFSLLTFIQQTKRNRNYTSTTARFVWDISIPFLYLHAVRITSVVIVLVIWHGEQKVMLTMWSTAHIVAITISNWMM